MSTFQISLAVIGLVLLGLVFAYNAWTYRRHAPRRAQVTKEKTGFWHRAKGKDKSPTKDKDNAAALEQRSEPDLLHSGAPVPSTEAMAVDNDPVLHASPLAESPDATGSFSAGTTEPRAHDLATDPLASPASAAAEPALGDGAAGPAPSAAPAPATAAPRSAERLPEQRRVALDALIDALALLQLEQPTAGDIILQVQPTTRRAGSKPFQVEGRNSSSGQWEPVRAGQRYVQLQAGVQLANRMGPLNEIEFSEFAMKVQTFADALGAALELPDMLSEVARARELDQFAGQHDAQLSFMLRPTRAAWSPGYIAQQASALGFVATNMPGRLHLPSPQPGQAPLLILSFDAQAAQAEDLDRTAVYELFLSLDVPQVAREHLPFARLCQTLQTLGHGMDGALCDPDGNPLPPQMLEQIGQQLDSVYDTLAAHEVAAGSMLACRLFS